MGKPLVSKDSWCVKYIYAHYFDGDSALVADLEKRPSVAIRLKCVRRHGGAQDNQSKCEFGRVCVHGGFLGPVSVEEGPGLKVGRSKGTDYRGLKPDATAQKRCMC